MKKIGISIFLFLFAFNFLYAAGTAARQGARQGVRQAARQVTRQATRQVSNFAEAGVLRPADFSRLSLRHARTIGRLGIREGDDIVRGLSNIHQRSRGVAPLAANLDDIGIRKITRADLSSTASGRRLLHDIREYTGINYRYINAAKRGAPLLPPAGGGRVGGQIVRGNEFSTAIVQSGNRIDDLARASPFTQRKRLFRGEDLTDSDFRRIFGFDSVGKSPLEIETLLRSNSPSVYHASLTSTSLLENKAANFATQGRRFAGHADSGRIRVLREIDAPPGTRGIDVSDVSMVRGESEVLLASRFRTQVTGAQREIINGQEVIRVFETIVP